MKDLPRRALAAVVAIPLLAWMLFLPTPYPFGAVIVVASLAALREAFAMLRKLGFRPFETFGYFAVLAFHLAAFAEWNITGTASVLTAPIFLVTLAVLGVLLAMLIRGMDRTNVPSAAV